MNDELKEASLRYHREGTPGKLAILPTKPLANKRDLARAYSPGVAYACEEIVQDPNAAASMTARGNLVAVISNGTAVLGLGAIGPLASKPVMEGKAVLFKKFSNIDVFDIEVEERDPDKLVDIIASLEPTFGGINLEDIKAPECFIVEKKLRERMKIPVFHDDQHGTAIVAAAAVYNGLRIVEKNIEDVRLVVSGGGAASIACTDLLVSMGLKHENVIVTDSRGVIYKGRADGMNEYKEKYAQDTEHRTLDDAIADADIFMGLSGPGVLTQDMVKKMADKPLILAMANPDPEILPELAKEARPDAIIATGRSDYPNQVNNVLCFPFIFRGALDCGATVINEEMKQACVKAIADLATKEASDVVAKAYAGEELAFGPDYLIPKPFDPRLIMELPVAVAKAAMDSGVAERPIEDLEQYRHELSLHVYQSSLIMQPMIEAARGGELQKIAYAEGENEDVLMAVQALVDEKIARPILIGRPDVIERKIRQMGLRMDPSDFDLVNPDQGDRIASYCEHYHQKVGRKGVSVGAAKTMMHSNNTVLASMMVEQGDAHGMICGKEGRFDQHLRHLMDIIGQDTNADRISSLCTLLMPDGPLFLADCFIGVEPSIDDIVATTMSSIEMVQHFGVTPRVALLSHSNFGTSDAPSAKKMRKASEILRGKLKGVEIDGEMLPLTAFDEVLRDSSFAHSNLTAKANLLIMPNLDTAAIALGLIRSVTNALLIGPFLQGFAKPAHIVIPSVTARGIFNMSAATVAELKRSEEA